MGTTNAQPDTSSDVCLIDTMFFLRTLPSLPAIFGGLAKTILKHACSFAATVHIVCDTYEQGPSNQGLRARGTWGLTDSLQDHWAIATKASRLQSCIVIQ